MSRFNTFLNLIYNISRCNLYHHNANFTSQLTLQHAIQSRSTDFTGFYTTRRHTTCHDVAGEANIFEKLINKQKLLNNITTIRYINMGGGGVCLVPGQGGGIIEVSSRARNYGRKLALKHGPTCPSQRTSLLGNSSNL